MCIRDSDNIVPQPGYSLKIDETNKTISLVIKEGKNKPYLYNSKAYKRNDTSTIEVDSFELTRLVLEGKKINFEDLPSSNQKMDFHYLENKLKEHIDIKIFNQDTDVYKRQQQIFPDLRKFPFLFEMNRTHFI